MKLKGYEKYQLEWLIEHGYSLDDLIEKLQQTFEMLYVEKEENEVINIRDTYEIWHDSFGFNQNLFASKDEWENNENLEKNNELNEEFYKSICNKYINTTAKELLLEIDNKIVHVFVEDKYTDLKYEGKIKTQNFKKYLDKDFSIYTYNSYKDLCEILIKYEIFYDIKDLGLFDENGKWNFYITSKELEKLGYKINEIEKNIEEDFENLDI